MKNLKKTFENRLKKAIARDPYLDKFVVVNKNGYRLKFKVEKIVIFDARTMYKGTIVDVDGNSCYNIGDKFSVSNNEIKYYSVLSK